MPVSGKTTPEGAKTGHGADRENFEDLGPTRRLVKDTASSLQVTRITTGVYWLQIPAADLYLLCGCPADVVKHLMSRGLISTTTSGGYTFDTGPNAILLSEVLVQNGMFSNLSEFPVLQMLFRQGMILTGHPNNTGTLPILIGSREQVQAQKAYIFRGSGGLTTREELLQTGISRDMAADILAMKKKFDLGAVQGPEQLIDARIVEGRPVEIKNGVFASRIGFNRYRFEYRSKSVVIDLNLKPHETYEPPYTLGYHEVNLEYFAVIHSGEGNGWDVQRPCMASILVFQGRIYLIDAGPTILDSLRSLSIDPSEIEGIFHTHAHDDHFAGLPVLMHSDHRIKYYATPLVRTSIAKKLSALMSIREDAFSEYFDVRDLEFGVWNDVDGLEVKPYFSPHPVETNIFVFRALGKDGYRTYAHWADISSLDVLENMVAEEDAGEGLSRALFERVKSCYQLPVDLKKVDVGGGPIHGSVYDFKNDPSGKIILAHTARRLTIDQKETGSETSFGTVDVLIPTDQDYLRKRAAGYLQQYFADVAFDQLRALLNVPMDRFNPGSIIQKKGEIPRTIFLILSGSAEFLQSEYQVQNTLSSGCFTGDIPFIRNTVCRGTLRAISHVRTLCIPARLFRTFLDKNHLYSQVASIADHIDLLQKTYIFGEGISYPVQNAIARAMRPQACPGGTSLPANDVFGLYLLKEGELRVANHEGILVETLKSGDFCGEQRLFFSGPWGLRVRAAESSIACFIEGALLLEIPIVRWKLLESATRRRRILRDINFFAAG